MEWPPKSGQFREFPELDKAEWFSLEVAKRKVLKGQAGFIEQLKEKLTEEPRAQIERYPVQQ
jgi:predicted NUDIX family NTP pyrophosphohydrolase